LQKRWGIEGLITADGYDEAFVGVADRFGKRPCGCI